MSTEKTAGEILAEKLCYRPKNAYEVLSDVQLEEAKTYAESYKRFLDASKTEREAVKSAVKMLEKAGFVPFEPGKKYTAGDKVYFNNHNKSLCAAAVGKKPVEEGVRIAAAHIDSPRLDLKPRPLYEKDELGYFKTQYYGGVRKYQWAAIPLALHGVVVLRDGRSIDVIIGEDEAEPVLCVTDLLPHLSAEQNKRTLAEGIKGEELNLLIGSRPFKDDKASEKVKLALLELLFNKYGIVEEDFLSAELCAVPSQHARDVGLDGSMIGSYGHDDRVCSYPALTAGICTPAPETTWVVALADKEEIGSEGNTGLQSTFLEYFIMDLAEGQGGSGRRAVVNSQCLSADVNAAYDPSFPDPFEKGNSSILGKGPALTKYTGSRGKGGSNDASAEFLAKVRTALDEAGVAWQSGCLGKVDAGGGGTVAAYVANLGVDVVDIGVPVLSMHAPFEVVSKNDVYCMHKCFEAFFRR